MFKNMKDDKVWENIKRTGFFSLGVWFVHFIAGLDPMACLCLIIGHVFCWAWDLG